MNIVLNGKKTLLAVADDGFSRTNFCAADTQDGSSRAKLLQQGQVSFNKSKLAGILKLWSCMLASHFLEPG